jgi:hypothetical protein
MLGRRKEAALPYWMHLVDWIWMTSFMVVWLVLIAVVGYAAVLATLRHTNHHGRPKST